MIEYKSFDSERCFGVEMEAWPVIPKSKVVSIIEQEALSHLPDGHLRVKSTPYEQSDGNGFWHVKTDSTCGGKYGPVGWEVASFKASGYRDLKEIGDVADALDRNGLQTGVGCGFHVHVEIKDFNLNKAAIMLARWLKIERIMLQAVPIERKHNIFCKALTERKYKKGKTYSCTELWNIFRPKSQFLYGNYSKRVTMNLTNFSSYLTESLIKRPVSDAPPGYAPLRTPIVRPTVEFRFPEGTLSSRDIKNWVRLFVGFVDNSFNAEMPSNLFTVRSVDEFLSYFGLVAPRGDFYILSDALYDTKIWLLERLFNFGDPKVDRIALRTSVIDHLNRMQIASVP